jgi:hypothetical protein
MPRLSSLKTTFALLATMAFLGGTVATSFAETRGRRAPRRNQARARGMQGKLDKLVRDGRAKTFTRNGKKWIGLKHSQVDPAQYTSLGKNVVEFFISPGFHHLYTRIGDKTYSRISGLTRGAWYPGTSERVGVLVEFKDSEMAKLNAFLERAHANPRDVIGTFNYNGGRPPHSSNCTDYITTAKIGDRGQSVGSVCGTYDSAMPQGFLRSLMNSNSDRIKAVVVHNPSGTFNDSYQPDLR